MSRQRFNKKQKHQNNSSNDNNVVNMDNYITRKKSVVLIPRNLNQETYIEQLLNPSNTIVFGVGPAGTGKTMLAVVSAIKELKAKTIERIVVTRPAVGVDDEKHGFLPGDLNAKMAPWTRPIFDVIQEYYSPQETAKMIEDGIIEISPLAFMRGRTFKNCYIIADEMQNATPNQMKMLLTRIGDDSRMVVTGDIQQTDRRESENGLIDFSKLYEKFGTSKFIRMVKFTHNDIERHPAVSEILTIYNDK